MGYEIAFDPFPLGKKEDQELFEPVTIVDFDGGAPQDMTSD
jgi:hypothetical protein